MEYTESHLRKQNPSFLLEKVYQNTAQALRLKADYAESYQTRAEAHLIAARDLLAHGDDVEEQVNQGLQALADRAKHSDGDARDQTLRSGLWLVRARALSKQRKSASAAWEQAYAATAAAIKIDAEAPETSLARAELVRYQIELRAVSGATAQKRLAEGLAAAEQVLRQQPWNTFAQAAQAALWVLRGRIAADPDQRREWQDKGTAALAEALRRNSLLWHDYDGLLTKQ